MFLVDLGRAGLAIVVVGALVTVGCDSADEGGLATPSVGSRASTVAGTAVAGTAVASSAGVAASSVGAAPASGVAVYEDALERRVRLEYPEAWVLDPNYDVQFSGADGFVQIGDLGNDGQGLEAAVDAIAHHKLMPYGSSPTLEAVVVDGVEGVLVRPSADQLPSNVPLDRRHVAVVIPRGEPLQIGGSEYEYLVLYVDEAHVDSILASVVLLPRR